MSIKSKVQLWAVTTLSAAAVIGSVALATGASASTTGQPNPNPCPTRTVQPVTTGYGVQPMCPTPAPTPTVTPTQPVIPTPTPTPRPRLRPESFRLVINNNFSFVSAFGPVRGFGSDVTVTPILDHFLLPNNANRVNVFHAPLPFPRTNLRGCSVFAFQRGVWVFAGGTGRNFGATGHGNYNLVVSARFPRLRNGVCSLRLLAPGTNPLTNNNPRVQPVSFNLTANGLGVARA